MQLAMFVDPTDIIQGSSQDDPDAWDAYDIQGQLHADNYRADVANAVWAEKRAQVEQGLEAVDPDFLDEYGYGEYALNDTPLPWTYSRNGRPMLADGHHRVVVAQEMGTLLPILYTPRISFESISGNSDWHCQ